ncbi:RsiV family protein [Psychrobacter sp. FDAARGOS_221]|uniref:RsiV family protein n=1 Tax=Psychrobacter sp. FDAARGOS_221 TaxID=1975705 RepID=UPI000BB55A19|nr:RsiV family protein [Psychrobacter sp. FDAARGOS_221]PNK61353.1 DUF3298 domain-containing protein [Psychrobacter sp. FDAARGOS_221]
MYILSAHLPFILCSSSLGTQAESALSISDEFYFGEEGLVLVYQPYELGSFAQGFIELTIPYAMLEGVLRPEYL